MEKNLSRDISEGEIRILLWRKLHSASQDRLEHYRKTGRLILIAPDIKSLP
jgi:hypothetical protein